MSELVDPPEGEQPAELAAPEAVGGWEGSEPPADEWSDECEDEVADGGPGLRDGDPADDGLSAVFLELAAVAAVDQLEQAVADAEL